MLGRHTPKSSKLFHESGMFVERGKDYAGRWMTAGRQSVRFRTTFALFRNYVDLCAYARGFENSELGTESWPKFSKLECVVSCNCPLKATAQTKSLGECVLHVNIESFEAEMETVSTANLWLISTWLDMVVCLTQMSIKNLNFPQTSAFTNLTCDRCTYGIRVCLKVVPGDLKVTKRACVCV